MSNFSTDTSSKANGATHEPKNTLNVEARMENIAATTGERLGQMAANFTGTTNEYVNTGRDYVKENPVKGVAIAAGLGAIVGGILMLALRPKN